MESVFNYLRTVTNVFYNLAAAGLNHHPRRRSVQIEFQRWREEPYDPFWRSDYLSNLGTEEMSLTPMSCIYHEKHDHYRIRHWIRCRRKRSAMTGKLCVHFPHLFELQTTIIFTTGTVKRKKCLLSNGKELFRTQLTIQISHSIPINVFRPFEVHVYGGLTAELK